MTVDKVTPGEPVEKLRHLPPVYEGVLWLTAVGCPEERISDILGVPAESLTLLIEVARRKLARLAGAEVRDGMDARRP
jgi:hypothetical protein